MSENLRIILAFTCALPAITGTLFYKKIDDTYRPLVYIFLIALITEIISWITLHSPSSLAVNIYVVANTALHLWFFYNMQIIKKRSTAIWLFISNVMITMASIVYYKSIHPFFIIAACAGSLLILILAIEGVTKRVFTSVVIWYKDAFLVFCMISIIYYAYFPFVFSFRFLKPGESALMNFLIEAHNYINALSNILLTWVVLCLIQAKAISFK